MKNLVLTLFTLCSFIVTTNAQQIGVKGGLNLTDLTNYDDSFEDEKNSPSMRTSFHIGLYSEFEISDNISIQPELLYSSQGVSNDNSDYKVQLDYLNIPVMFNFYLSEPFYLSAGPQVGFLVSNELKAGPFETSVDNDDDIFRTVDFTMNVGTGFNFENGLSLSARYGFGLVGIFDLDDNAPERLKDNNPKNSVFQISVGYKF